MLPGRFIIDLNPRFLRGRWIDQERHSLFHTEAFQDDALSRTRISAALMIEEV